MADSSPSLWTPRTLTCSAGGVRAIGQLGTLATLRDTGVLIHVRKWYGCSGGALTALMGVLGASSAWLRDAAEHFPTNVIGAIDHSLLADFWNAWGVNSGDALVDCIACFVDTWEPGSSTWTFADLATKRPGHTLGFLTTAVSRGGPLLFSTETTPTVRIVDALRASMGIPVFYTPLSLQLNDGPPELFCDGFLCEYLPWDTCGLGSEIASTLAIVTDDTTVANRNLAKPCNTFLEYVSQLLLVQSTARRRPTPSHWIAINDTRWSGLSFDVTRADRLSLFEGGVAAAQGWLRFRSQVSSQSQSLIAQQTTFPGGTSGSPLGSAHPNTLPHLQWPQAATWGTRSRWTCKGPGGPSPSRLSPPSAPSDRRWSL